MAVRVSKALQTRIARTRLFTLLIPASRLQPSSHTKQNKKTHADNALISAIALLAVLSITCTFGGLLPGTSGPTGPIISMLPATSVDEKTGKSIDPKFTFSSTDPQIAVIIQLGAVTDSHLTVTWYQVIGKSDQKLFEDTISVAANDRAFSIGKNPGTLAAGDYKVIAALGNQTQEADLTVADAQSETAPTSTSQTQKGEPPVSGGSGTIPSPSTTSNGANGPAAQVGPAMSGDLCIGGGDDQGCGSPIDDSTANDLDVYVYNSEGAYPVDVTYNGVGGAKVGATVAAHSSSNIAINPCDKTISNPSDLPNAQFSFFATDGHGRTVSTVLRLGRDTSKPSAIVQTVPAFGSRVKAGTKITVTVDADDNDRPGTAWNEGLKSIEVTGPGGFIAPPWNNPDGGPKACDDHRTQHYEASYVVPKPPPSNPIVLCVLVKDFAGNIRKECGNFYTGDHWTGSMHTQTQSVYTNTGVGTQSRTGIYDSTLDFVVDSQGNVAGTGEATATSCPPFPDQVIPAAKIVTFNVSGKAYKDRFELQLTFTGLQGGSDNCGFGAGFFRGQPLVIPITGSTTAQGQVTDSIVISVVNHFSSEGSVDLKCDNCAPGVGMEIPLGHTDSVLSLQEFDGR
jgi:hypothetical protein